MARKFTNRLSLSILLTGTFLANQALASSNDTLMYQRNMELSVFSRQQPGLNADGILIGNYRLYPSVTTDFEYTDNLFASQTNKQDDFFLKIKPSVSLRSDFDRHSLDFFLNAEQRYHNRFSTENRLEYNFGTNSRYDLTGDVSFPLSVKYEKEISSRGDPDDTNVIKPTEYNILSSGTGITYVGQMFDFDALIGIRDYSYDDALTLLGTRNNQDRNRTEINGRLRLGLSSRNDFAPYVFSDYRKISYDDKIDDQGFNRSAHEIEGGIGARFKLSSLTTSSLEVGYVNYHPDDPMFSNVRDLSYRANIVWEPSTLTAFSLSGQRGVSVTTLNNLTASVDTLVNLGATYELTPVIFVRPGVSYEQKDYKGVVSAKLEKISTGLNIDYKMNKNMWWTAQYQYIDQKDPKNSPSISEYDQNTFLISLKLQF